MGYKLNVFTGTLDLVNPTAIGNGVVGITPSTDKAIPRWSGTAANTIQDSKAIIQDGGAILAQGYITQNEVTNPVSVGAQQTWIAPDLTLETGGDVTVDLGGTILVEG